MKHELGPSASSTSQRESSPIPERVRAKSIGCMSGLFQLLYKYHNTRGRFLTFGKKQEKNAVFSRNKHKQAVPSLAPPPPSASELNNNDESSNCVNNLQKFSDELGLRSPALPADIRRLDSLDQGCQGTTDNDRWWLKGLNQHDDVPVAVMTERRRQQLLGAVERCNQDLRALTRIIEAVRKSSAGDVHDKADAAAVSMDTDHCCKMQEPIGTSSSSSSSSSSDSVSQLLHELLRSASTAYSRPQTVNNGRYLWQQKKKPGEVDISNICLLERMRSQVMVKGNIESSRDYDPFLRSKAMVASVNEVCRDIMWGERRENGRIGLALQDGIYKDLIQEMVCELSDQRLCALHSDSCKRRLRF